MGYSRNPTPARRARIAASGSAALLGLAVAACSSVADAPQSESTSAVSAGSANTGGFKLVAFGGTGKCLDVAGGAGEFDNARTVQMWSCVGSPNQRFIYVDGEVRGLGGKCLDAVGGDNGARIQLYDCWGGTNQKWAWDGGRLRNGGGRCLDVAGGDGQYTDGARVQLYDCNSAGNQSFDAQRVSDVPASRPIFANPVYGGDFADPFVLSWGGSYYAFATNAGPTNVPRITSTDLVHWSGVGDAMPTLPSWVQGGLTWAPSVWARGNGTFVMYFTARPKNLNLQCIGRAVANAPAGPYYDSTGGPLICQTDRGGSIDASPFVDASGAPYITWKNDGNCCNLPVSIWAQKLSADGLSLVGNASALISRDQSWENPLIEGPSMIYQRGKYTLLYSANWWESSDYGVGYATCDSPLGPCRKPQNGPVMRKADAVAGPGGQEFFRDRNGGLWIAYHAWTYPKTSYTSGGARSLRIDPVAFDGNTPVVVGPTASVQ